MQNTLIDGSKAFDYHILIRNIYKLGQPVLLFSNGKNCNYTINMVHVSYYLKITVLMSSICGTLE